MTAVKSVLLPGFIKTLTQISKYNKKKYKNCFNYKPRIINATSNRASKTFALSRKIELMVVLQRQNVGQITLNSADKILSAHMKVILLFKYPENNKIDVHITPFFKCQQA